MTTIRLTVLIQALLLLVGTGLAKEVVRVGAGDGHLAVREGVGSAWRVLAAGDAVPESGRWRTSAAGASRVDVPGGTLFVAADSELEFDLAGRRIVLFRGRARLALSKDADDWKVATKVNTVVCSSESEVDVTSDATPAVVHVLRGEARLTHDGVYVGMFAAPAADIGHGRRKPGEQPREAEVEAWANRVRAATRVRPAQGMGQLVAKDAQSDSPVRLEVARYHVNVVLHAPVALVQIDQSFFNPYGLQQEGTFVFNLPHGASVSRFAMFVEHDKLIEGELIDRKRADEVYTTIVRRKRDPAILEQIGDNLFRMRVFPIFARDTKRILLDYTVPLVADAGRYRFELPLMSDLKPIWDFGLTGTIHRPFASDSISSPTHPQLKLTATGDTRPVTFSLAAKDIQPPPTFAIEYRAPRDRQPEARGFLTQAEKGETRDRQHFIVTLPETENPTPRGAAPPADVLVLVDTSGSAGNLTQARLTARTLLNNLRPTDRVRLGCVDITYRPLTENWLVPGSDQVREALHKLDDQFSLGASDLDQCVNQAMESFDESSNGRRRNIVYIGDGVTTMQNGGFRWSSENFQNDQPNPVVFNAICIADVTADRSWLRPGVKQTGGRLIEMNGLSTGLSDVFAWSLAGLPSAAKIESVRVAGVDEKDLFVPQSWPYGRELHLYGRGSPAKSLDVSITLAGQPEKKYSVALSAKPTEDDVFTGRLWAQHKLQQLLSTTLIQSDNDKTNIVDLCQEWSLMSPYTAFLVLESEEDYGRWKIDRKKRHRYWKPSGTIVALSLPPHLRKAAPPERTPSANVTVRTTDQQAPTPTKLERATFDKHLAAAKRALVDGDAARALAHLHAIESTAKQFDAAAFEALQQQAQQQQQREMTLKELDLWRRLADRREGDSLPALTPLLLSFAHGGLTPEFLERHPHADKLVKRAPEFQPTMTLKEFGQAVQESIGIPVLFDGAALDGGGYPLDMPLDLTNLEGTSFRSLLVHALEPHQLECVPTRHLLRITTKEKAAEEHSTQVYPVLDLVRGGMRALPGQLAHPYIDLAEATQRRRTETRLKKPVSVRFEETPVEEALAFLSKQIGEPIWLDKEELKKEGIKQPDQRITFAVDNLPVRVILDEMLKPLHLTHAIRDEVLSVTTMVKAQEWRETRVYSAAGLVDDQPSPIVVEPNYGPFGGQMGGAGGGFGGGFGGMAGFGGAQMGGGGGGAIGVSGGAIGVGGGGFGGGGGGSFGGGGSSVDVTAGVPNGLAGVGDVAPPMVDNDAPNDEPGSATEPGDSDDADNWDWIKSGGRMVDSYDAQTPLTMFQENTSGKWEIVDGEGGTLQFDRSSFSFVIHNTQRVHEEIQEMIAKLRRLPVAIRSGKTRRPVRAPVQADVLMNFTSVMSIFMEASSQKWEIIDGEGGTMSPFPRTGSLTIRQTARGHEEIERVLVQMRRARYIAESLPWQTSLEGIDDFITLFDRPTITDLPRGNLEPKPAAVDEADELKRLAARKRPAAINQRWRSVSSATGQRREVAFRQNGARLELVLPDRTLRAEGLRAAVAYPRLTLVEIEAWGDAARQVADSALPWLPHRTNEELAREFDVTTESEDATSVTLRLDFVDQQETFLKATFSKKTGLPVKWLSVVTNEPQYELRFEGRLIVAVDPNGKELERWELVSEFASAQVMPLDENWGDFVVVDPRVTDAPLALARAALRKGEYAAATETLSKLVAERPEQPLLNFLLAWSCEFTDKPSAARARQQRAALSHVAAAGPSDLLRLLTPGNFNTLGSIGLHEILLAAPVERRTAEYWDQLAELAVGFDQFEVALTHVDHGLAITTDDADRVTRQLLRVELLLRSKRPREAASAAKQLAAMNLTAGQLAELGDYFGRDGLFDIAAVYFERGRRTNSPTDEELAQLFFREARWHQPGEHRWRLLIAAEETLPQKHANHGRYGSSVLQEADRVEHAAILGLLADTAKRPATRTQLRLRQAELTDDAQLASDIALELFRTKRIGEERQLWMIETLQRAKRFEEIVQHLEPVLRRGDRLIPHLIARLTEAYTALGRTVDARRGDTEATERPPAKQQFPGQQMPQSGGGGVGFFRVQ